MYLWTGNEQTMYTLNTNKEVSWNRENIRDCSKAFDKVKHEIIIILEDTNIDVTDWKKNEIWLPGKNYVIKMANKEGNC